MKYLLLALAFSALSLTIMSFTDTNNKTVTKYSGNDVSFEIPDDVQAIIDNSCYGCHNNDSRSDKSKNKLNFDNMPTMKTSKQVSKLMKISKVVRKGKMPVEKFIAKYPDKALSKDQTETLASWADELATKLSGE